MAALDLVQTTAPETGEARGREEPTASWTLTHRVPALGLPEARGPAGLAAGLPWADHRQDCP